MELSEYRWAWRGARRGSVAQPDFSINADGFYDFSSFRFEKADASGYGGSAEFVAGPVPLRFATTWDSRGKGKAEDRVFVAGGVAYGRPAPVGGGRRAIRLRLLAAGKGPRADTVIGFKLGLRIHPEL